MSDISFFYTTCPNEKTAQQISQALLQERLVACTNLFPVIHSQYWWEGKIESSKECVLILKSSSLLRDRLEHRFLELHPYDTPCFIEWKLDGISLPYRDWLLASLKVSEN